MAQESTAHARSNSGSMDSGLEKNLRIVENEQRVAFIQKKAQVTKSDFICTKCLDYYGNSNRGVFAPVCQMTCQIQQREREAQGEYAGLESDDKALILAMENPVAFAKLMFGWEARKYQQELLLCSSQQKVVRAGRRIGKTESMVIFILWLMYVNTDFEIIVICPYERQVELIFGSIRKFLAKSKEYQETVVKDRKDPQSIFLRNGSNATGFTAGVKTGEKAAKVRGQGANALFIDECDYLDTGSIEALMALFVDNPNVLIWASSTPTGKRSDFYRWNTEPSLGFKMFHYTSRVSPYWNARTELYFRSVYSTSGFQHEFLAEFGEAEFAVFKSEHLDASIEDYYYQDIPGPRVSEGTRPYLYTFGVDWNSTGTGVHIVVLEYSPETFKFKTVYKEVVDPKEFTQTKAVDRIIKLNDHWRPRHIYVDQGFGEMQIEELHQYGKSFPSTGLHRIVKGIVMGSKTEIVDPVSGLKVKKYTKELTVEIAARRVEEGQCVFPRVEDIKGSLVNQLRDFEVVRYSVAGKPVYSQGNEHTATAWMLSVFAMMMEFTSLARSFCVTSTGSVGGALGGPIGSNGDNFDPVALGQRSGTRPSMYRSRSIGDLKASSPYVHILRSPKKLTIGNVRRHYKLEKRKQF